MTILLFVLLCLKEFFGKIPKKRDFKKNLFLTFEYLPKITFCQTQSLIFG